MTRRSIHCEVSGRSEAPGAPGGRPRPNLYSFLVLVIHILLFFFLVVSASPISASSDIEFVRFSGYSPVISCRSIFVRKPTQVEFGNYNYRLDAVRVLDPSHNLRTSKLSWCS